MGFFSKDILKMDDLFVHTLRDIYYAENQILKALPEMIEHGRDGWICRTATPEALAEVIRGLG